MAQRKYADSKETARVMAKRARDRARAEREAVAAAVNAKRMALAHTGPSEAVMLYRETKALWEAKGRVLDGTSGRHPIVGGERQRGPRVLLLGAL